MTRLTSRRRAGSTMVEIGVAMLLFLVIAGSVSVAATRAIALDAAAQLEAIAGDSLDGLLAQVSAGGYDAALGVEYDPTLPGCPTGDGVCVDVGPHRDRPVAFDVEVVRETRLAATATSLRVTASVTVPGGSAVARTTTILAPASGFAPGDRGVVRIGFDGPVPSQVLLLDTDTEAIVGSTATAGGSSVVVSVPPAACTRLDPCRIALNGTAPYFDVGGVGLAAPSARLMVTATNGAVADVTASTFVAGQGTLSLTATNPLGTATGSPGVPGSVCLWAQLPDLSDAPLCNTDDAAIIDASHYPMPGREDLLLPLPAALELPLSTDRPDGTCPLIGGHVGHRSTGWSELAVCTSYTWGNPTTITRDGGVPVTWPSASLLLTADGTGADHVVSWSGTDGQPATGTGSQPVWSKPREAPGCADDGSCAPLAPGAHPEATSCPGQHCLSVATLPPAVTSPAVGSYGVHTVSMSAIANQKDAQFDFEDPDGDDVTVTLLVEPNNGSLARVTTDLMLIETVTPLSAGDTVTTFTGSGSVDLRYTKSGGGAQLVRFTLLLDDGTTTVEVPVAIHQSPFGWSLLTDDAIAPAQGSTGHVVDFLVVGTSGEPRASVAVDVDFVDLATETVLSTTSVTSDGAGVASISLDLTSNPPAGDYELRGRLADTALAGDGITAVAPVTIVPTAGSLTLATTSADQGEAVTFAVDTLDLAGDPMAGAVVTFDVPDLPVGATLSSANCVTDATGSCQVQVLTDAATPSGTYAVTASSGAFSDGASYQVLPVVALLEADDVALAPGSAFNLPVTVLDGGGRLADGAVVTGTIEPGAATVAASATSDADGIALLTVTVPPGADAGVQEATFTSGSAIVSVKITVTTSVGSLTASTASVALERGGETDITLTVTDAGGSPIEGVAVTSTVDGEALGAQAVAYTDAAGVATFTLEATGTSGAGTVEFTAGTSTETITYTVGG